MAGCDSQPAMMDHVTRRPIHQGETRGVHFPAPGKYGTPFAID
jgi:hypothetical protein